VTKSGPKERQRCGHLIYGRADGGFQNIGFEILALFKGEASLSARCPNYLDMQYIIYVIVM